MMGDVGRTVGLAAALLTLVPASDIFSHPPSPPRCLPGALPGAADHHWDPALLPGAGGGPAHPPGQHRRVALRVSPPGGHRLLQLHRESGAGPGHLLGGRGEADRSPGPGQGRGRTPSMWELLPAGVSGPLFLAWKWLPLPGAGYKLGNVMEEERPGHATGGAGTSLREFRGHGGQPDSSPWGGPSSFLG